MFKVVIERDNSVSLDGKIKKWEVNSRLYEIIDNQLVSDHPLEHDHNLSFEEFFLEFDYSKPKNLFKSLASYYDREDLLQQILEAGHYYVHDKKVNINIWDIPFAFDLFNLNDGKLFEPYLQTYLNHPSAQDKSSSFISRLLYIALDSEEEDKVKEISKVLKETVSTNSEIESCEEKDI
jgi:hypothetical protein